MTLELKKWLFFPPEESVTNELLFNLGLPYFNDGYSKWNLIWFLKTWTWLINPDEGVWWLDDAHFWSSKQDRITIFKEYIRTISVLWKDKDSNEIELHIEYTFSHIHGVDIKKEIEAWRNQDIHQLKWVTKWLVFDLLDAKILLKNSEVIEFNNTEEIFFFVLDLLNLRKFAKYLRGEGKRMAIFPLNREESDGIFIILNRIREITWEKEILKTLLSYFPTYVNDSWWFSISEIGNNSDFNPADLQKIRIKKEAV